MRERTQVRGLSEVLPGCSNHHPQSAVTCTGRSFLTQARPHFELKMTRRVRIARTRDGLLTVGGLDLSPGAFPRCGPRVDLGWQAKGAVHLSSVVLDHVGPQRWALR